MRDRSRQPAAAVASGFLQLLGLAVLFAGATGSLRGQLPPPRPVVPAVETVSPRITGNPFSQVWRAEDYGGASGNTGIVQHPGTGRMYVGNGAGVLEFDGARWRLVPLPHGGAVLDMAVDAAGRIWAISENEIARLERDPAGILQAETAVFPLPEGETGAMDQALAAGGAVWFRGSQHVVRLGPDGRAATWRTGERFGQMWWMDGAMHTKVSEREVVRLEDGGRLETVVNREILRVPPNRQSPFRVFASRDAGDGETILLTALGPARWRGATRTWRALPMRPPLFREAEAIAAAFLPDGAMAFVTARPSGVIVTPDGRVERLLDRLPNLMTPRVTRLAADPEGGLWVTSRDHIARLQVRSAFARHDGAQGLQGDPRYLLRADDALLVAHSGGVARYVDWPGIFPPLDGLHRGAEALAMAGGRTFAAATGLLEVLGGGARAWSNLAITSLSGVRGRPDVLLGGDASGVWWFQLEGGEWRPAGRMQQLPAGQDAFFDAGNGRIWGAAKDGRLWRFEAGVSAAAAPLAAPVKHYGPAEGVPALPRLPRIQLFNLGGATLAASPSFLLRHDAAADRFVPETRIAGLPDPAASGPEAVGTNPDGTGWLRMAAPDRRFLRLVPDGAGRWRAEELPAPMLRDLAAVHLLEDRGTLWVAGKDLLASVDLQWRPPAPLPTLTVGLRQILGGDGAVYWTEGAGRELALEAGDGSLRFEFAAAAFTTDHRGRPTVNYRTRLAGFETGWRNWSAEPWRDFTRLPAGTYRFQVQATDQAGRTSAVAELPVTVTAPWWSTRWAWLGYFGGAGLTLLGLIRFRTRTLRRRALELEALVAARTEELQRSNAELARLHRLELDAKAAARLAEEEARLEVLRYQLNPHFLYNALNSVYSLALTAPPAAANMVLKLADFCRIALDRRQEEHTTVGAEFDKLAIYLEIEKVRWGDGLQWVVQADERARHLPLPPFLLLPLVENAMKYGGATCDGELRVRVAAELEAGGALRLTVANTGAWVDRPDAVRAPSSGIGLANLRQRLQRYHPGSHELEIEPADGWVTVRLRLRAAARREAAARF